MTCTFISFYLLYTSYATISIGIPWNIPQVTCIFSVYTRAQPRSQGLSSYLPLDRAPSDHDGKIRDPGNEADTNLKGQMNQNLDIFSFASSVFIKYKRNIF